MDHPQRSHFTKELLLTSITQPDKSIVYLQPTEAVMEIYDLSWLQLADFGTAVSHSGTTSGTEALTTTKTYQHLPFNQVLLMTYMVVI